MPTVTLRPSGDGTTTGWTKVGGTGTYASCIVDDPDSNDGDTSYISSPELSDGTIWIELDDVPADFDPNSINSITIKFAANRGNPALNIGDTQDDTHIYVQLERADETTDISVESSVANVLNGVDYTLFSRSVNPTGSHTVTDWDGVKLKIRFDWTQQGGENDLDGAYVRITAAEVIVDYISITDESSSSSSSVSSQSSSSSSSESSSSSSSESSSSSSSVSSESSSSSSSASSESSSSSSSASSESSSSSSSESSSSSSSASSESSSSSSSESSSSSSSASSASSESSSSPSSASSASSVSSASSESSSSSSSVSSSASSASSPSSVSSPSSASSLSESESSVSSPSSSSFSVSSQSSSSDSSSQSGTSSSSVSSASSSSESSSSSVLAAIVRECACCLPPWTWKPQFTDRITTRQIDSYAVATFPDGEWTHTLGPGNGPVGGGIRTYDYGPEIYPSGPKHITGMLGPFGLDTQQSNTVWVFSERLSDGITGKGIGVSTFIEHSTFDFGATVRAGGVTNAVSLGVSLQVWAGGDDPGTGPLAQYGGILYTNTKLREYTDLSKVNDAVTAGNSVIAVGKGVGSGPTIIQYDRDGNIARSANPVPFGEATKITAWYAQGFFDEDGNSVNFPPFCAVGYKNTGPNETHNVYILNGKLEVMHSFHALYDRGDNQNLDVTSLFGLGFGHSGDPNLYPRLVVGGESVGGVSAELYDIHRVTGAHTLTARVGTGGTVRSCYADFARNQVDGKWYFFWYLGGDRSTVLTTDGQPYSLWKLDEAGNVVAKFDHKGAVRSIVQDYFQDSFAGGYRTFLAVSGDRVPP